MSSIYNNPELEMMAKEIQAMLVEKLQIEKECQERQATTYISKLIEIFFLMDLSVMKDSIPLQDFEYNMSVKKTEIHSLQSEFDTLSATLKQLTSQRDVAQKRLDALDEQVRRM